MIKIALIHGEKKCILSSLWIKPIGMFMTQGAGTSPFLPNESLAGKGAPPLL